MTDKEFIENINNALKNKKVSQSDKQFLSDYLHINLGQPELKLNTRPAQLSVERILEKYGYL